VDGRARRLPRRRLTLDHARALSVILRCSQHRNTPENDVKAKWTFTPEYRKRLDEILKQYPPQYKKAAVIPALDLAQRQVRPARCADAAANVRSFVVAHVPFFWNGPPAWRRRTTTGSRSPP